MLNLLMIITVSIVVLPRSIAAVKQCPKCGSHEVPYPLSTGPDCGDQEYKIRCSGGELWFDALNGSTNPITSIDPTKQTLILRPPGFDKSGTCVAADFHSKGIQLDPKLPFNVTSSNTLIVMNCSVAGQNRYASGGFHCSKTSACHRYIRQDPEARARCRDAPLCCWFKTGGTVNEHKVYRARKDMCSAYASFVNLDVDLPMKRWPEQAVEIQWALPREPVCRSAADCKSLKKSQCLADPRGGRTRRCLCQRGFTWDPVVATCQDVRCAGLKGCKHGKKSNKAIVAGVAGGIGAVLIGVSAALVVACRKHDRISNKTSASLSKLRREILINNGGLDKIYSGREIMKATNNFAKAKLIGTGGFGEVFKGFLADGTTVAVKRAKIGNEKSVDQIANEVRILCQVKHKNLVKLLGCCVELDPPMLIYEYIPNGTLFQHLHGFATPPLTWQRRLRIAHQTALALAYLHFSARPPIYHRDVKSSNILLDENLDARVSDFGLSRLGISDASHVTTCAQGTLGYLDPEYYLSFQLTDKSDVYSFAVVLLELLTAKKAIDFNREEDDVNLVVFVRKSIKEEKLVEIIDPAIRDGASKAEMESMKAIGLLAAQCLSDRRYDRPSMKTVANEIERIMSGISPTPEGEIPTHLEDIIEEEDTKVTYSSVM